MFESNEQLPEVLAASSIVVEPESIEVGHCLVGFKQR